MARTSPRTSTKQRGSGTKKRIVGPPPTPPPPFGRKDKAAQSIRASIRAMKRAGKDLHEEEEDAPVLVEELFRRLAEKTESAITWTLIEQLMPGLWSDKHLRATTPQASDLTSAAVANIAKCFSTALANGFADGSDKREQLTLQELTDIDALVEEISTTAVKKAAKVRNNSRSPARKQSTHPQQKSKKGAQTSSKRNQDNTVPETIYEEGDVLLAKLPGGTGDLWWPAAIAIDHEKWSPENNHRKGDQLVSLLPTHERYWIPLKSLKKIPATLRVPKDLVKSEAEEYAEALELLRSIDKLEQWLEEDSA